MAFFLIVIGAILFVIFKMVKDYNKDQSNPTGRSQNDIHSPWNRPPGANQNPQFNSHLCDDGQHDGQNPMYDNYDNTVDYAGSYNTSDMPMVSSTVSFSKHEREQEIKELKDLLAAGIISQEEYRDRRRELL